MKIYKYLLFLALVFLAPPAFAFQPFVVRDIRLEGLQRVQLGTVFSYLPIKIGDTVDEALAQQAIHALYRTGFFKDVRLDRDGEVLTVFVAERPAIAKISFTGNSAIPSEKLQEVLNQIGLVEGRILDRSILDKIGQELKRQYFSLGKYAVRIDTTVSPLVRNRVEINIAIAEGEDARIRQVHIVGNHAFSDEQLLDQMELPAIGFFGGRESYSRQILAADLEALRSYYQNRGYVNFAIESTQVALTPDKQDVYITINIKEGEQYRLSSIKVAGDPLVDQQELASLIHIKTGDVFSREKVQESRKAISDRLAELGYAFANVNISPDVDKDSRTVSLTLFVEPGRRVYVRRVNIFGNGKTRDEVIRREIRQMEGSWLSTRLVSDSRTRLDRLGFFEQVGVETPTVPGSPDMVDVNFTVAERPTGTLSAGLGYSDSQGALVNFSVSQQNFLGTGKRVAIELNNSQVTRTYSFSYNNPYYTESGISRGFRIYSRSVDLGANVTNITNYSTNTYGASINWGIPLSETNRVSFGVGYENTELLTGTNTAQQILDFIAANGNIYDTYKLTATWRRDTRNRAIFADRGARTTLAVSTAVPGGDLEYYTVTLRHAQYFPIAEGHSLLVNIDLGHGDVLGDTQTFPPFENFFAGGSRSVRGYDTSTLGGPATRDAFNNPIGGTTRVVTNLEWLFPNPFVEKASSMRFSLFVDGGWVYAEGEDLDLGELRYSAGISAIWLTPIGAMRFSLATPLNEQPGDRTQSFQFTLGSPF